MNDLLFYTLLGLTAYYFMVYLPNQKSSPAPKSFTRSIQTEPISPEPGILNCPSSIAIPDPEVITKLEQELSAKQEQIQTLQKDQTQKNQHLTELQVQIRELVKRPLKPTNSKSTQTSDQELTNTLDTLIKSIQELNNSL